MNKSRDMLSVAFVGVVIGAAGWLLRSLPAASSRPRDGRG